MYQPSYPYPWGGITPAPQFGQQPMAPQPPQPQQQGSQIQGVRWVSTMDEVNGTTIGLGESALFMFTGENAFAIKSVSASGVPQVKVFDFSERQPVTPASYVTREEFEKLKEQINVKPVVQPAAQSAPNGHAVGHADDAGVQWNSAAGTAAALQPGGADGVDPLAVQ